MPPLTTIAPVVVPLESSVFVAERMPVVVKGPVVAEAALSAEIIAAPLTTREPVTTLLNTPVPLELPELLPSPASRGKRPDI